MSRQWGVRLPTDFKVKSLKLVAQPTRVDISEPEVRRRRKLRERKAVVLLTSEQGQNGTVDFVVYQLQTTPSIKTQSSDSYKEQNPYSILSRCCSIGQFPEGPPNSSISGLFLASASFQFDLVRQKSNADNRSNGGGHQTSEIVGTVGVFRSPGFGLDAIVVTSAGLSKVISVFNYNEHGNAMLILQKSMKSLEVSSYWLSDVVNATRPISTSYGENGLIDLFVWTIQLTDGKLLCWFVPCLEFHSTPSQVGLRAAFRFSLASHL